MDIEETEVCTICDIQHDCSEGSEQEYLGGEWVCTKCQETVDYIAGEQPKAGFKVPSED